MWLPNSWVNDRRPFWSFRRLLESCVILDNAKMRCFGRNFDGQLGLGDTADRGYQASTKESPEKTSEMWFAVSSEEQTRTAVLNML